MHLKLASILLTTLPFLVSAASKPWESYWIEVGDGKGKYFTVSPPMDSGRCYQTSTFSPSGNAQKKWGDHPKAYFKIQSNTFEDDPDSYLTPWCELYESPGCDIDMSYEKFDQPPGIREWGNRDWNFRSWKCGQRVGMD